MSALLTQLNNAKSVKEVWLINNGGCEWASRTKIESKFRYIKAKKNGGYGYGHNLAIAKLSGAASHHIISNPDIILDSAELDEFALSVQREEGLLMPNVLYPDGTRQELCKLLPNPINLIARRFLPQWSSYLDEDYLLKGADYSKDFFVPSLSGCFMICRTACLKELGGFDERYFMYMEDVDLSRRLAVHCGARFMPNFRVQHEFQKGSYKNRRLLAHHIRSAILYFNKWGWFFDRERRSLNAKCLIQLPRAES